MKQRFFAWLSVLCLLLSLTACGGGAKSSTAAAAPEEMSGAAMDNGFSSTESAVTEDAAGNISGGTNASAIRQDAKLILRADVYAEAQDYPAADAAIEQMTAVAGGYIENVEKSGSEGYRSSTYTLRIPQEKFETFLETIGNTCHILSQSRSAEDIGQAYYDTETRLKTLQTKQERLLALLEKADKMEDIIQLENSLSDTQYQIDSLSGTLQNYDRLVGFATITLSLSEVRDLTAVQKGNSFSSRLVKQLSAGTRGLVNTVQSLILVLCYLWPLTLLVLAALIIVLRRLIKRRRASRQTPPDSTDTPK